jgi:hypothetical protein
MKFKDIFTLPCPCDGCRADGCGDKDGMVVLCTERIVPPTHPINLVGAYAPKPPKGHPPQADTLKGGGRE